MSMALWKVGVAVTACVALAATEHPGNPPAAAPGSEPPGAVATRIDDLIRQLGSESYIERSEAERKLLSLGYDAFDQLKAAEESEDPEIAARARHLTRQLTVNWAREEDSPAVREILQSYARRSAEQRFHLIDQLAALGPEESLEPLCRIARFDESDVVSKRAALALINATTVDPSEAAERSKRILEKVGRSQRISVAWLRTYAQELGKPADSVEAWQKHVDAELAGPESIGPLHRAVAIDLLGHVADIYEQLEREDELLKLLLQMVELDDKAGSAGVLERLVERLIRTKNWRAVDEIVDRYADRFRETPLLMYMLAEARREQGDREQAQELAEVAFNLSDNSMLRMSVADKLVDRGLYKWAEREYRDVLVKEPAISNEGLLSVSWLTAMLYDIQRHKDAADLLENYLKQWEEEVQEKGKDVVERVTLLNPKEAAEQLQQLRARADYNRACHARMLDDRATERKYLEQAIEHSPRDIDVLIAMYRLPEDDVSFRSDVLRRIEDEAKRLDAEVRRSPNNPINYNNWAWLIANTRGDFDKAVRYAERAVDLAEKDALPGYLDTLGRAYYAKGELETALKHQRRAAELDPHTQQLQRQLAEFEQAHRENAE